MIVNLDKLDLAVEFLSPVVGLADCEVPTIGFHTFGCATAHLDAIDPDFLNGVFITRGITTPSSDDIVELSISKVLGVDI